MARTIWWKGNGNEVAIARTHTRAHRSGQLFRREGEAEGNQQGDIADGDVDGVEGGKQQQDEVFSIRQFGQREGALGVENQTPDASAQRVDAGQEVRKRELHGSSSARAGRLASACTERLAASNLPHHRFIVQRQRQVEAEIHGQPRIFCPDRVLLRRGAAGMSIVRRRRQKAFSPIGGHVLSGDY